MFTVEERDELRDRILQMAHADARVVAAAEVGSLALGEGDRWSDIDLTFAIDDSAAVDDVLGEWTSAVVGDMGGVELLDLVAGPSIYRVFMFPDWLQLDLSFTPASEFRPTSPRFRLIFGRAGELEPPESMSGAELVGWAVLYAKHARVCMERELWWQAEHCITSMRQHALSYACQRRDLPAEYGRGVDRLPPEVRRGFASSLVRSYERDELQRALKVAVDALAAECAADAEIDRAVIDRLSDTVAGI